MLLIVGGSVFGYKILAVGNKISTANRSVLGQLTDLLFSQGKLLRGEEEDRINIMLLAIGGAGHSGENLADTIMIASLRPSDKRVTLLSIPRDLYVKVPSENFYSKINAVHAYGENRKKDGGPELLKQMVEDATGLRMHYYGRVDFTAFKQIVDAIGGVDIEIANSFFDYWHKIDFRAGKEHMDGERALAYARARYIEGPEGGDFKRTTRQQQLLLAIQQKVFSMNTALDFGALDSILNSVSSNVRTDGQLWEMKRFYEIARQLDRDNVRSVVMSSGTNGVLVGTTEILGGVPASVLKTKTGDFSEVRKLAANMFSETEGVSISPAASQETEAAAEPSAPNTNPSASPAIRIKVEIRNGTNIPGLALKTSSNLEANDYEIIGIGNADNRSAASTIVYLLKPSAQDDAENIAKTWQAKVSDTPPENEKPSQADILIILGADAK